MCLSACVQNWTVFGISRQVSKFVLQVCYRGDTYLEFFHRVVFGQNATFREPFVHLSPGKIEVIKHALLCPLHGVIPTG
jgi:hypothetical protein